MLELKDEFFAKWNFVITSPPTATSDITLHFFQNGILTKGNFLAPTPLQSILLFWSLGKWKVVNSNECCPNSFLPPLPPANGHHRALFADPIFFLSDRRHDIRNENTVYILPAMSICIKYTTLRFVKRYPFSLVFWYYPVVLKSAQTILVTILTPPKKTKKPSNWGISVTQIRAGLDDGELRWPMWP